MADEEWLEACKASIERHYNEAFRMALQTVKKLVHDHMERHPDIQSFVMCMGGWTYYLADGTKRVDEDGEEWDLSGEQVGEVTVSPSAGHLRSEWDHPELDALLCEWDQYLKITGSPWRLDRVDGELVPRTDW